MLQVNLEVQPEVQHELSNARGPPVYLQPGSADRDVEENQSGRDGLQSRTGEDRSVDEIASRVRRELKSETANETAGVK